MYRDKVYRCFLKSRNFINGFENIKSIEVEENFMFSKSDLKIKE